MSVQDIVNNNPNAYDPMNGEYAPEQIAQYYKQEQQQKDVSGLNMNIVNPSSFNDPEFEKKRLKAAEQFKNGGLPFSAPDKKQTLEDMMGGFLFGGAIALLIGAAAPVAIGIGLLAANSNHDTDTAMQHRFGTVKALYKEGIYSDDALWQYMTTGNNQLLQQERTAADAKQKAIQDEQWKREDYATQENDKRADALQNHNWDMQKEQYVQGQENARAAMQENRADARAMAKNAGNAQGPTPYGYYSDTDGDGKPDTWVVTTSRGTPDAQNGNIHQLKLTANGWVDQGYQPLVGVGGNTKSDTAAQTAGDVIDKASSLASQNYTPHSSSIGRGINSVGNWFTGNKHDFDTRAGVVNNSMASLLADRAVNSTGGKSVLREDMAKQTESGGKISASNSPEVNQEILNNNINLVAGVQYINEYQNDHHGQMPSIDDYKKGRDGKRADIYKAHPELLNAFGESNDLPGQSGNINSYPSADKTDYSKLWK